MAAARATTEPILVLVPGAHGVPNLYNPFLAQLRSLGVEVLCLPLQSAGRRAGPAPSLYDDAAFISSQLTHLAAAGRPIILAGHSYGGMVITSAALPHLHAPARAKLGLPGGIVRLVYITALVPRLGESLLDILTGFREASEAVRASGDDYQLIEDPRAMAQFAANDIPVDEATALVEGFVEQSTNAQVSKAYLLGYEGLDVTYVFCEKDLIITPELQSELIGKLKEKATAVDVVKLDAGHLPNSSRPKELAEVLSAVTKKVSA